MLFQCEWGDIKFNISERAYRGIVELSNSYKIESVSDKTSSKKIIKNHSLQEYSIGYEVSSVLGINPMDEYKRVKSYLGKINSLVVRGTLFGPDYVMLNKVSIESDNLNNDGKLLTATITLDFKEYDGQGKKYKPNAANYISPIQRPYFKEGKSAIEDLVLKVLYNGVDITKAISVNSCVHDMFACSEADRLILKFNDTLKQWDGWQPKNEEIIEVVYGIAKTGKMFIDSVKPENGLYTLRASSTPTDSDKKQNKSWENVRFLQLGKEIADRHGLGFESYGVEDKVYTYVRQDDEEDFAFLQKRCDLESCAFVVYDKKLIIYSEDYLEGQDASAELELKEDADYTYVDNALKGLGSLTIKNGNITGRYISPNGLSKTDTRRIQTYLSSTDEANRFAKGIWKQEQKKLSTGHINDDIMREFSAGSVINLKTTGADSWNGKVFVSHIRQDYVNSKSKLFFRKV